MNQAAMDVQSRRRSVRYNGDTLYCGVHQDAPDKGAPRAIEPVVVIDASLNGLGLIFPFEVTQGQELMIDIAGGGHQVGHLRARVCNVQRVSPGLYRVGVAFGWEQNNSTLSRDLYWAMCDQLREKGQSQALW